MHLLKLSLYNGIQYWYGRTEQSDHDVLGHLLCIDPVQAFFSFGPDSSLYIQSIEEQPGPSYQAALICYLVRKHLLCG
jgi:hypothetical protein